MSNEKINPEEQEELEGCGCEHDDIVELVNNEGKTLKFIHVATIDYQDEWYVFFSPAEEVEEISSDEVVIFRLDSDEEGKDVFAPIDDEDLLQKVYDEYVKIMDEEDEEEEGEEGGCGGGCSGCGGGCH